MAIERPGLWKLGGVEASDQYEERFTGEYRAEPLEDILGRVLEFPPHACAHVCFKPTEADPYRRLPRTEWSQERAERLPWIRAVVTSAAVEIRPSHREPGTEAYLVRVQPEPPELREELYVVYVRPIAADRVVFLTAFVPDQEYWQAAMRGGGRIYPPQAPKPKKPRKRRPVE